MQATLERPKTKEIRKLIYKDMKQITNMELKDNNFLVGYVQDHVSVYKNDSEAIGIFENGQLAGAILVGDYFNMDKLDIPQGEKKVNPVECCIINAIMVDRRFVGKGYGTELIKYELEELRQEGKKWLYATMCGEELILFYAKNGFYELYGTTVVRKI